MSPHSARLAIVALLVVGAACGSADKQPAGGPPASTYFVSEAKGWDLRKAYKPRPDDPVTSRAEPSLDWYAEHQRYPDPSRSQSVRLSGHDVPLAELEATLSGLELRSRDVGNFRARVGSPVGGPRLVLLPVGPAYTVMTLSYELSLDELIEWSQALRAVNEADWIARGGIVV